ncbi:endogenous retrovirus group K member 6 Gag polyprotein-like [Lonchura striata]
MQGSRVFSSTADASLFSRGFQPSSSQMLQTPLVSVSAAAPELQPQQMTPLYRQVPTEFTALQSAKVDWQDIRAELEKEKGLLQGSGNIMMPVNYDAQGQNPRWERLDRGAIKDLAKAIRDNGLSSPYFKQMLKSIFGMYDLTPYDLKYLATSVLTDTQALVWQKAWRRSLEELRARYQGGPNANLTMAQLAGDPPEDDPTQQAAVERQVSEEGAKPHLIKSLAFSNANPECRRIISMMPHQATLADMIEACSKVGTPQHVASIMEEHLGDQIEKCVREALANYTKSNPNAERRCFGCGAQGHIKRNCPQLSKPNKPPDLCPRCRRGKHLASECHSQTDVDGKLLPIPGNGKKSRNGFNLGGMGFVSGPENEGSENKLRHYIPISYQVQ